MSWRKMPPNWSLATLPIKPQRAPKEASPAMVLAAEPPERSMAGPMASYRRPASSAGTRRMKPLARSCLDRKDSSQRAMISTMALPMPTTSNLRSAITVWFPSSHPPALVLAAAPTIFAPPSLETPRHARRRSASLSRDVHAGLPRRALQMPWLHHRPSAGSHRRVRMDVRAFRAVAGLDRDHHPMARRLRAGVRLDLSGSTGDLADG